MSSLYERLARFAEQRDLYDTSPAVCVVHRRPVPCQQRDDACRYSDDPVTVADILGGEE